MNGMFLEANHDLITRRVHSARRKALAFVAAYPRIDLFGGNATPDKVKTECSRIGSLNLFSGMGHGGPDEFTGQGEQTIFDLNDSQDANRYCSRTIVHLFSCDCGQRLGEFLMTKGARAFIGYKSPVSVPKEQSVVDEFVKVAAAIDHSILAGDSYLTTKSKADAASRAAETAISANPLAEPRDLASFRLNQREMVAPWTNSKFGTY